MKKVQKTQYVRRERGRKIYYKTKGEMSAAQRAFEKKQEEKKERAAVLRDIAIVNKRLKRLKAQGLEKAPVYQNAMVAVNQFNRMIAQSLGKPSPKLTYEPKFSLPRGLSRDLVKEIGYTVRLIKTHEQSTVKGVKKALSEMGDSMRPKSTKQEKSWRKIDRNSDRYRDLIMIFTILKKELEALGISSDEIMEASYDILDNPDVETDDIVEWVHELNQKIDNSDPALRLARFRDDMIVTALDKMSKGQKLPTVDDEIADTIDYQLSMIQSQRNETDEFLEALKRRKS